VRRAAALVRALAATSGAAAVRRGLPVYGGLFAVAGLLFGGNGLQATTVVAGAEGSLLARALLWGGWWVIAAPTVEALWRDAGSFWLRSLPVPRAWHLAVLLGMTIVAEGPWLALWAAGGGIVAGLGALGGALAGHALWLARPPGGVGLAMLGVAAVGLVVAPVSWLALATWPIVLASFRRAWLAAPARAGTRPRAWIGGPPALALTLAHLAGLWRGQVTVLLRGLLLCGLAAAAAWLAARTNGYEDIAARLEYACGFLVPAALVAGSAASGPVLASEARAEWLLRTGGASMRVRLDASVLAAAIVGAGLGAAAGGVLAVVWGIDPGGALRMIGALALAGGGLAGQAGLAARWAAGQGTRGPGRLVALLFLLVIAGLVMRAQLGAWAPAGWAAAAIVTWLIGHVRAGAGELPAGVEDRADAARGGATVLLEMTGIRKRLGGRWILDGVALGCAAGEVALVLGENGAGKSTLLRIAAGIVVPDAGRVSVGGAPIEAGGVPGRAQLGYAPDTADAFPELSVRELIALVVALRRAAPPDEALRERLGLAAIWHQRLRTLSFGQVKRSYLLAAMVGSPPLLILDEPSNGLDPAGAEMLAALLRERAAAGGAALVTTNDAGFAAQLGGARRRLVEGRLLPA
jgi:ABC-type Mn2+/Zn2+ transport system ATPase subunit